MGKHPQCSYEKKGWGEVSCYDGGIREKAQKPPGHLRCGFIISYAVTLGKRLSFGFLSCQMASGRDQNGHFWAACTIWCFQDSLNDHPIGVAGVEAGWPPCQSLPVTQVGSSSPSGSS